MSYQSFAEMMIRKAAKRNLNKRRMFFIGHQNQFSYLSIKPAAIIPEAIVEGTPPPGCVEAPVR